MRKGERIAAARKRLGLSQYALAKEIGVDDETISRWEHSENVVSAQHWLLLSMELGIEAERPSVPPTPLRSKGERRGLQMRLWRLEKGMDTTEMGDLLEIAQSTVTRWELGAIPEYGWNLFQLIAGDRKPLFERMDDVGRANLAKHGRHE